MKLNLKDFELQIHDDLLLQDNEETKLDMQFENVGGKTKINFPFFKPLF